MTSKKPLSPIETVLEDNAALSYLKTLEDSGCNHDEIIALLSAAFRADVSWETLVGMDLRGFKRTITEIRHCADIVDRLNGSELVRASQMTDFFLKSPTLAERLRFYVSALNGLSSVFGPKRNFRVLAWKAAIVALVTEDTKKPHDLEVSALIAAVLDDPEYSPEAHKTWRQKHRIPIQKSRKYLQEERLKRASQSPPGFRK